MYGYGASQKKPIIEKYIKWRTTMEVNRCEVCKKIVPDSMITMNITNECGEHSCHVTILNKNNIKTQIDTFKDFFATHTPTEINYKEYFESTNRELNYQQYCAKLEKKHIKPATRRMYFQAHVISVHAGWPDEFGRMFTQNNNGTSE